MADETEIGDRVAEIAGRLGALERVVGTEIEQADRLRDDIEQAQAALGDGALAAKVEGQTQAIRWLGDQVSTLALACTKAKASAEREAWTREAILRLSEAWMASPNGDPGAVPIETITAQADRIWVKARRLTEGRERGEGNG